MDFQHICMNCMREKKTGEAVCPHCGFDERIYMAEPYALPPFTVLNGKYLLGRVLGAGEFAIIYIAWDKRLERVVAIKEFFARGIMCRRNGGTVSATVRPGTAERESQINRKNFEQEAKTLVLLESMPGIVRVFDFFLENNTSYMVMEYLSGLDLKQYVRREGEYLGIKETLQKLFPVMKSLCLLHRRQIFHGNITPDNIKVMADGSVKLLGFGSGKSQSEEQRAWTDVHGMAATVYYCLRGELPVRSRERQEQNLLKQHCHKKRMLSPEMEKVLSRGLEEKAEHSYQTMEDFMNALKEASENPKFRTVTPTFSFMLKWLLLGGIGAMAAAVVMVFVISQVSMTQIKNTQETDTEDLQESAAMESETDALVYVTLDNGIYEICLASSDGFSLAVNESEEQVLLEASVEPTDSRQLFSFNKTEDGQYRIRPIYTWLDFTVKDNQSVVQAEFDGTAAQLWRISYLDGAQFAISNEEGGFLAWNNDSGLCLTDTAYPWKLEAREDSMEFLTSDGQETTEDVDNVENSEVQKESTSEEQSERGSEEKTEETLEEETSSESEAITFDASQEDAPSVEDNAEIRSGYYIIATAQDSGKLLHIVDNSEEEGAFLDIWEDNSDMIDYQVFYIEKQENGRYKIIADINNLSLDVKDASNESGAFLQIKTYDATVGQQWYLIPSEDGYYYIRNELGTYLDCAWGSMENGTAVNNVDWNGGMNQKWQLYWNGCVDPNGVVRDGTYSLATAMDSGKQIIPTGKSTDEQELLVIGGASDIQTEMVTVERQEEGWYKISFNESGLVFDVKDASTASGAFLQQKNYDATEGQHWYFELSDEGNLYIRSELGTYIDLSGSSTEDGTAIKLVDFNGNENQQWNLFPDGKVLKSVVAATSDGSEADGTTVASETIEPGIYQIVSAMDQNKVLRVANDSAEDGATFVLWDSDDSEAERFYVEQFEDGTCKIMMNFADKSLDVKDASSESGAVLQQRSYDATEGQQWILQPTDDGYYYICSVLGTCLDCDHANTENGTTVSMIEQTQSENQKWALRRVG